MSERVGNDTSPGGARVACCQCPVADLDVDRNLARVESRVRALPDAVEVALFPETVLTGFVDDRERLRKAALARDGPELGRVRSLARESVTALLVGFVERDGDALFNATAYVPPDGDPSVYRKRHLWGAERDVLAPGERRVVVESPAGPTGLLTCYDLNFVAESAWFTERRVDALFVVGAWPAAHAANWRLLCRARALDGARWVVACGRTGARDGDDPERPYAGASMVVRPAGDVAHALGRRERDLVATLDPAVLAADRREVGLFDADAGPN